MSDAFLQPLQVFDTLRNSLKQNQVVLEKTHLEEFLNQHLQVVRSKFGNVFGLSDDIAEQLFKNTELKFEVSDEEWEQMLKCSFEFRYVSNDKEVLVKKEGRNVVIENYSEASQTIWTLIMYRLLKTTVFGKHPRPVIFPVERNSIYTFKTELSINRISLINKIQDIKDNKETTAISMIENNSRRYPIAIRDALNIAYDVENIQKTKSKFYDFACNIEKDLLGGTLTVGKNGDVLFSSLKMKKSSQLPIHITSSIVKTLSSLIFYLKHSARQNDVIFIDEPEMNLHPDSLVVLARFFAELVNKGFRLFISTHSDFIVRELNNLIMAGSIAQYNKKSLAYPSSQLIDYKDISVYYFHFKTYNSKTTTVEKVLVDKYGFDVKSMDTTIEELNEKANNLYYELRDYECKKEKK